MDGAVQLQIWDSYSTLISVEGDAPQTLEVEGDAPQTVEGTDCGRLWALGPVPCHRPESMELQP